MTATAIQQKLEKLKEQRKALDARIRKEAAKAGAEGRKRKNRQKYIVGGIVLAALHENNALAGQLLALIKSKASNDDLEVLADALPQQEAAPELAQQSKWPDKEIRNLFGAQRADRGV